MNEPIITVYTPESSLTSPLKMLRDMFHDLAGGRELIWRLVVRDINAHYRQAFLGILLVFIFPVANNIVLWKRRIGTMKISVIITMKRIC